MTAQADSHMSRIPHFPPSAAVGAMILSGRKAQSPGKSGTRRFASRPPSHVHGGIWLNSFYTIEWTRHDDGGLEIRSKYYWMKSYLHWYKRRESPYGFNWHKSRCRGWKFTFKRRGWWVIYYDVDRNWSASYHEQGRCVCLIIHLNNGNIQPTHLGQ